MANVHKKVLSAVTTGTSEVIDTRGYWPLTMAVQFGSGTTAGTIKFEASADPAFTGTWKSIGDAVWAAASTTVTVSAGQDAYRYVRARVTVNVAGGTASVWITASGKGTDNWTQSP